LIPKLNDIKLSDIIFGFEELENNMHPAMLRRLCHYIEEQSKEKGFTYFLTTHSNVLIDLFHKNKEAQIVHVNHNDGKSHCRLIENSPDSNALLDDLGVKASDILQANGIIWVEGPSDRVYLNKWIELWLDGKYEEGYHYQILFTGGTILAHFTASDILGLISILKTNRNAAILMDRDFCLMDGDSSDGTAELKPVVKRIQSEFEQEYMQENSLCWITEGKEVENYVPVEIIRKPSGLTIDNDCDKYSSFPEFINELPKVGLGTKFQGQIGMSRFDKVEFARVVTTLMTKKNLQEHLDLDEKMNKLCDCIKAWNPDFDNDK
jgi:hypothetical protein